MFEKLKIIISLAIGIPAFMIACGETDMRHFWVQIIAWLTLITIIAWNRHTNEKENTNVHTRTY